MSGDSITPADAARIRALVEALDLLGMPASESGLTSMLRGSCEHAMPVALRRFSEATAPTPPRGPNRAERRAALRGRK